MLSSNEALKELTPRKPDVPQFMPMIDQHLKCWQSLNQQSLIFILTILNS